MNEFVDLSNYWSTNGLINILFALRESRRGHWRLGGLEAGRSVPQVSWNCFGWVLDALGKVPGGSLGMLEVSRRGPGRVLGASPEGPGEVLGGPLEVCGVVRNPWSFGKHFGRSSFFFFFGGEFAHGLMKYGHVRNGVILWSGRWSVCHATFLSFV